MIRALAVLSLFLAGCAVDTCSDLTESAIAALPRRLSETGRYDAGVIEFTPAFSLWSDGAQKRRALFLPAGTQIDTSDMDDWRFPKGTRLWKDFVRDGVLVETRFFTRSNDGEWAFAAYVWNGDDAELSLEGAANAGGTPHDVPAASKCHACHGGRASTVLGFSAVQLANVDRASTGFDLSDAIARGLLSHPPSDPAALRVPGDATERAALGYLHANCSHCHNQSRPATNGPRCYDPRQAFDFLLRASELSEVRQTATYRTALVDADVLIRGQPARSPMLTRMTTRTGSTGGTEQMPPLATETVDADGVAVIRAWIEGL